MFYQWTDSMSVGVPLIDNDHKALIHLINRLHESVSAGDTYDALDDLLNRMVDYIDIHFTREERVMEACGYPETAGHKGEHGQFVDYIKGLRESFTEEKPCTHPSWSSPRSVRSFRWRTIALGA